MWWYIAISAWIAGIFCGLALAMILFRKTWNRSANFRQRFLAQAHDDFPEDYHAICSPSQVYLQRSEEVN